MPQWPWLLASLALSATVWWPITQNYFFSDDFLNLYQIANQSLPHYLVTPNGGHVLLTRNAVFYLSRTLFGTDPGGYYWSIFATHMLNVGLLFLVVYLTTKSARLASFGAALWGASPANAETLGWYAVYGHVLVGTVLLVILIHATMLASRPAGPRTGTLALWGVLALMGATSFGTGLGVAVVLPVVLWLWLPATDWRWRRMPPLAPLVLIVPALYVGLLEAYARLSGDLTAVATPMKALPSAPLQLPVFLIRLVAHGFSALLLGFWRPTELDLTACEATLALMLGAVVLVMWRRGGLLRRRLAACLLLLLSIYGVISLGRAFVLGTNLGGIMHTISRYQYAGTLVASVMLCLLLAQAAVVLPSRLRSWPAIFWYAITVAGWVTTASPIDHHDTARTQTQLALTAMRAAVGAQPAGSTVLVENRVFEPLPLPPTMFPGWAGAFIAFFPVDELEGRRIRFVERNAAVVEALRGGRRTGTLLVTPR